MLIDLTEQEISIIQTFTTEVVRLAQNNFSTDVKEHILMFAITVSNEKLSIRKWWARQDLNLRPRAYQARALTN